MPIMRFDRTTRFIATDLTGDNVFWRHVIFRVAVIKLPCLEDNKRPE